MAGYVEKAQMIVQRQKEEDEMIDLEEKNALSESTPDRFDFKLGYQHQRQ